MAAQRSCELAEADESDSSPGEHADLYGYELFTVRDRSVEEQVRRFTDLILADDPRKTADRER